MIRYSLVFIALMNPTPTPPPIPARRLFLIQGTVLRSSMGEILFLSNSRKNGITRNGCGWEKKQTWTASFTSCQVSPVVTGVRVLDVVGSILRFESEVFFARGLSDIGSVAVIFLSSTVSRVRRRKVQLPKYTQTPPSTFQPPLSQCKPGA